VAGDPLHDLNVLNGVGGGIVFVTGFLRYFRVAAFFFFFLVASFFSPLMEFSREGLCRGLFRFNFISQIVHRPPPSPSLVCSPAPTPKTTSDRYDVI